MTRDEAIDAKLADPASLLQRLDAIDGVAVETLDRARAWVRARLPEG